MNVDDREYEQYLESNVVVSLKENRFLYGIMKSYDQYNSVTLNFVTERIFYQNLYAEKKHGLIALRGENIVFITKCQQPNLKDLVKGNYDEIWERIEDNSKQ